jgi:hypothetical protein
MSNIIPCILLIGRPAAGKSEVIDYLKKTPVPERLERFHIGEFTEIDDFPYIWNWFEEDDILQKLGRERLYTKPDYYFKDEIAWDVCLEKINLAFEKLKRDDKAILTEKTVIIEFARGGENAFAHAFSILSEEILKQAGICYIKVSYEESSRKNQRRKRKGLEDSVLFHSLPQEKMDYYYKINDWDKIASGLEGTINVKGIDVPYTVLPNEPEVTDAPEKLGPALETAFGRLWKGIQSRK